MLDHSSNYNLPSAGKELKEKSTIDFLLEYGLTLFKSNMYAHLCEALERLPKSSTKNREIQFLSAITYVEIGNLVDSDYYFRLCDKHTNKFNHDQLELLNIQRFRLEYCLGRKTRDELREMLWDSDESVSSSTQKLSLKISLLGLDLLDFVPNKSYDEEFIASVEKTFEEVDESDLTPTAKQYLLMHLADILSKSISGILTQMFLNTKISETLGLNPASPERQEKTKRIQFLNQKANKQLLDVLKFAENQDDEFLESHARYYLSLSFFGYSALSSWQISNKKKVQMKSLKKCIEVPLKLTISSIRNE